MKTLRTCITPDGKFMYGIHKPSYSVLNLRQSQKIEPIGLFPDGTHLTNEKNYPRENVEVTSADWIFEIPNPFFFRGTTYIDKEWADASANDYSRITLPKKQDLSFTSLLQEEKISPHFISKLPRPVQLSLATCSTDPEDLITLAKSSCDFHFDEGGQPKGLHYSQSEKPVTRPVIHDHDLFEAVANNIYLPDVYKIAMVIRPGAQGGSEIVGETSQDDSSHVFEYLRRNSYIAGGHYAANMADDSIRYTISDLTGKDMQGLRHLYYQRTYTRLARLFNLPLPSPREKLSVTELEELRMHILDKLAETPQEKPATLWGWNFGFDYAPSGYRLHASHQQIHQQYALIPKTVTAYSGTLDSPIGNFTSFSAGDMIEEVIQAYGDIHNSNFFDDYFQAIVNNRRMDERKDLERSLIVWEDDNVLIFVPKAQTSQWELQLMTKKDSYDKYPGNIVETTSQARSSLDRALLKAQKIFNALGAKMVTSIEYSKRIGSSGEYGQPLVYSLLPKLPDSPGAFSEAQLRFINGHYPEDFAAVCRLHLEKS